MEELGARVLENFATGGVTHTFCSGLFDIECEEHGGFISRFEGARQTRTPRHDFVIGAEADVSDRLSGHFDLRHVADTEPSAFPPADNLVDDYTLCWVLARRLTSVKPPK